VRLAGVSALARLADDWEPHRQTCIDVLCAYLRMPYHPENPEPGEREVRLTVIRLIRDHLRPTARVAWSGRDLDFTAAVFDGGDFNGATLTAAPWTSTARRSRRHRGPELGAPLDLR